MSHPQRSNYLKDPTADVGPLNHDKLIPPWMIAEAAAAEEPWEADEKKRLEVESLGRAFKQKFLTATKMDKKTNEMTFEWKPEEAAKWLQAKVKVDDKWDPNKASQVLASAGCTEERRTEVMELIGAKFGSEPEKFDEHSPNRQMEKVKLPQTIDELELDKDKELRKRKTVASYGIILTDDVMQLYKKGALLAEVQTEDVGGYAVLADEIECLTTEAEVHALFGLEDEEQAVRTLGWLKPQPEIPQTDLYVIAMELMDRGGEAPASNDEASVRRHVLGYVKLAQRGVYDRNPDFKQFLLAVPGRLPKTADQSRIHDSPTFERNDREMANPDRGEFRPDHVDQSSGRRDFANDPGPASVTPGARAPVSPSSPTFPDNQ